MNKIQYITTTHTSKAEAEENKKRVNYLHNIYLKESPSFEEITFLHDKGSTIGRVGDITNYLTLDIDRTNVTLEKVKEHFKGNPDYYVAKSVSCGEDGLKYHLFVNLNRTITRVEYKAEVKKVFDDIKARLCVNKDDYMILDENAADFYQCFFGSAAEMSEAIILSDSRRLMSWVNKDCAPKYYEKKVYPSLNAGEYCRRNGLLTLPGPRFDIFTPHMTGGRMKKIPEGCRFARVRVIGAKLLMRIFYLNNVLGERWTRNDYLSTFEFLVRMNVVMFETFASDFKVLSDFFGKEWDRLVKCSYEEQSRQLERYFFGSSQKQYRSRQYAPAKMSEITEKHKMDSLFVLFDSKDVLKDICKVEMIDYYKFLKYADSLGLKIVYEEVMSDKRQKHFVKGMSIDEFNSYCKENRISSKMKWKLKKRL